MKTKLIGEMGCNHNGSMEIAERMIAEAAALGCWAVKVQKRDIEAFAEGLKHMPRKPENSFGPNYYEHRKALEFSPEQIARLKGRAESAGLQFVVSVFDTRSIEEMAELRVKYLKLPSQYFTVYHLCRLLFAKRREYDFTAMASTGMHTEAEVESWQYREAFDVVMYCRSIYPARVGDTDLAKMRVLRNMLTIKQQLGYSSHDEGGHGIPFAVALGAEFVERHFTLDKSMKGSDHSTVSSDPEEMRKIVCDIEYAEDVLGSDDAGLSDAEKRVRKVYRGF